MQSPIILATEIKSGRPITWNADERLRHLYVIGKSGTGKSTLLANTIRQDIEQGNGVLALDPHGDMLEMVVAHIPPERKHDVMVVQLMSPEDAEARCNALDVSSVLDGQKVLLISLGKGHIGEELSQRLGHAILARFVEAMLKRRGNDAKPLCSVYLEEVQNWWQKDLEPLLVSGRSCGVSVVIAHQYLNQFDEETRNLILGNMGNVAMLCVGMYDAEQLEPEFAPTFTQEHLIDLPRYHVVVRKVTGKTIEEGVILPPLSTF
jgi:ABC-type oligopeptide transport system ATPase subunit